MNFSNAELLSYYNNLSPLDRADFLDQNRDFKTGHALLSDSTLESAFVAGIKRRLPANADWILDNMLRNYKFSEDRKWELDFAWHSISNVGELKVAVEVQGIYSANRGGASKHLRPQGYTADREKIFYAQMAGWIIIEATPLSIDDGSAFAMLMLAFETAGVKVIK